MQSIAERIATELADAPAHEQQEVLDFAAFLRSRRLSAQGADGRQGDRRSDLTVLAATAWEKEWSDPDEEAAWANL